MLDSDPQNVSDSLKAIEREALSRSNKAYYDLLKVISDDKTYVNFNSDSLINAVSDYYRSHDPKDRNYVRSLAYQGIVRTRMGVKDSTVYEPLREADKLIQSSPSPDPSLGYLIYYFLGNIHYNNRNYISADDYFNRTLSYAREENDSIHIFDSYLALYWNGMGQRDIEKGKVYLDSLSTFYNNLRRKNYFILNAQSIYYDVIGEPEKALEREKAKLTLYSVQDEKIELSRAYFNISNSYAGLEQLDSAMLYGQMAINMIEDSSKLNYLYYQNVANIAEKQNNYILSNKYLKKAFELHNRSIRERLDTQIAELEKKYDLTEAENEVLKAREQNSSLVIAALSLVIVLIIILMSALRVRRKAQLKLLQAEHRMEQQDLQASIMNEEAGKRKWLLQLYSNISDRLTFLHNEFEQLTQRYISTQPKVYKEMQHILKNTDTDLRDLAKTLAPDNTTFYAYTGLKDDADILNANEKMLLMLLACNADNRQLATFMNTTVESIRVRKSQLKKKMTEKRLDISLFSD
jgi:tetratricopeptide (TPR) repeat protein